MEPVKIAVLGTPNTGKSTLFNALTGKRQHTGNWAGKTVGEAMGIFRKNGREFHLCDLPGIYSLLSDEAEERCSKRYLLCEKIDGILVVADGTNLEKSLPLALQAKALCPQPVVLCVNLMDEAEKMGMELDIHALEKACGMKVITTTATKKCGLGALRESLWEMGSETLHPQEKTQNIPLPMLPLWEGLQGGKSPLFCSLLLEEDEIAWQALAKEETDSALLEYLYRAEAGRIYLQGQEKSISDLQAERSLFFRKKAEEICQTALCWKERSKRPSFTEKMDRLLLGTPWGMVAFAALFAFLFWITAVGANVPSSILSAGFTELRGVLEEVLLPLPVWLRSLLLDGIYLTTTWVIAVMLPPMAIFFPLFTLLEDFGLLPRIAFLLDGVFHRVGAHGKQGLTMCMGFGCNAVGVTACRIIEDPAKRMIAILTNTLVPCNGRFGLLIILCTLFFSGGGKTAGLWLILWMGLAILISLGASFFLSRTLLSSEQDCFCMELPPYRMPQVGQVLLRSLTERTIFVLLRAVKVAVPAGIILWIFGRATIGGVGLMEWTVNLLEPIGGFLGLDGAILLAFFLGFPANEIVLPIVLMCYCQSAVPLPVGDMTELAGILSAHGWTMVTAVCTALFSLNHFPCATTLATIRKETGSLFWTVIAFLFPTAIGVILCAGVQFFFGA